MAFKVSLEDEDFTRSRVDTTPYEEVIRQGIASEKVVGIVLDTVDVKKTRGVLARCASAMGVGLRWDVDRDLGDGTTKIRFRIAEKRAYSPEAAAKRKATMEKNGTKAGRKPANTAKKAS